MDGTNVMPVMDVGGGENNANWFLWIIVLLALMGGGNFFGGRNNGSVDQTLEAINTQATMTRQAVNEGFVNQDVTNNLRGISDGMINGFNTVNANLAENRFAQQQCCCDIKTAIHSEGETTRALITQNAMQDLRDRLADKDRELATANMQLSNMAQSQNIIGTLRPYPQPAWITSSPYQAATNGYCPYANV